MASFVCRYILSIHLTYNLCSGKKEMELFCLQCGRVFHFFLLFILFSLEVRTWLFSPSILIILCTVNRSTFFFKVCLSVRKTWICVSKESVPRKDLCMKYLWNKYLICKIYVDVSVLQRSIRRKVLVTVELQMFIEIYIVVDMHHTRHTCISYLQPTVNLENLYFNMFLQCVFTPKINGNTWKLFVFQVLKINSYVRRGVKGS